MINYVIIFIEKHSDDREFLDLSNKYLEIHQVHIY